MEGKFENINKIPQRAEAILNDWDKKYLIEGGKSIILKMYEDFNKNFPDVIILPETAARPLYYLFSNVFEKVKEQKGTKIPNFVFFNVGKRAGLYQSGIEEDQGIEIETNDQFLKELVNTEVYKDLSRVGSPQQAQKDILDREDVEKVATSRAFMKERAYEILDLIKGSDLRLAIIDEFSSSGQTEIEINKAFNKSQEKIPSYSITGFEGDNTGVYMDGEVKPNPSTGHWNFSYGKSQAIGVTKSFDEKYSKPIQPNDKDELSKLALEKKQLREEMKGIGESVSKEVLAAMG